MGLELPKTYLKRYKWLVLCLRLLRRAMICFSETCHRLVWRLARPRAISLYLCTHEIRKLQIGSGECILDGWLNTDIRPRSPGVVYLDANADLPFPDHSFDYIMCEHVIEHLDYPHGLEMLRECYRILKPDGVLRISTPDIGVLAMLYAHEASPAKSHYMRVISDMHGVPCTECHILNTAFHCYGHRFSYDKQTLVSILRQAGFAQVASRQVYESDDPSLRDLEQHGKVMDTEANRFETMVLEARK